MSNPYPPPGPPGPGSPYPGQPYPGGAAGSAIALTTKFFPTALVFYLVKPSIALNGQPVPGVKWGRVVLPVQPGQHHLHVHTPYFLPSRIGPVDVPVAVAPGQTVELEYRTPVVVWAQGSLGPPPQKYNGVWLMWVLLGLFALALLCCIGSAVINAGN